MGKWLAKFAAHVQTFHTERDASSWGHAGFERLDQGRIHWQDCRPETLALFDGGVGQVDQ